MDAFIYPPYIGIYCNYLPLVGQKMLAVKRSSAIQQLLSLTRLGSQLVFCVYAGICKNQTPMAAKKIDLLTKHRQALQEGTHSPPSSIVLPREGVTQIKGVSSKLKVWMKDKCHSVSRYKSKASCLLASRPGSRVYPPLLDYSSLQVQSS